MAEHLPWSAWGPKLNSQHKNQKPASVLVSKLGISYFQILIHNTDMSTGDAQVQQKRKGRII